MFSDCERVLYRRSQLLDVVCQLRFPTILSIEAKVPADFQEKIRGSFPRYSNQKEFLQPKVTGQPGAMKVVEQPAVTNYQFLSADGTWKVNLTKDFIALATPNYVRWEEFAAKLDQVLAAFIEIYNPAFFERVGLRYINAFSRKALGIEEIPFAQLIQPAYLGLMAEEDVNERSFARSTQDVEMSISGGCRLKLHAGPGMVKKNNIDDGEVKFILDNDIFMLGNVPVAHAAAALNTVHIQADRVFRGAITQQLHDAMEPEPLD